MAAVAGALLPQQEFAMAALITEPRALRAARTPHGPHMPRMPHTPPIPHLPSTTPTTCTPPVQRRPPVGLRALPPRLALLLGVAALAGCMTTGPKNDGPKSSGAAGGAAAVGADAKLNSCTQPVGTVRLFDGMTSASDPRVAPPPGTEALFQLAAALKSLSFNNRRNEPGRENVSLEALRLLIQQSNCFVIVDRGAAEMAANDEKGRARHGSEMRDNANMGAGQEVAADFVMRSAVLKLEDTGGTGLTSGGLLGSVLGGVGMRRSEQAAQVQLVISDLRSKVQVAVAQGEASSSDTKLAVNVLGRAGMLLGGAGVSSESKTSGSTLLMQAFADAYNKLVPALTNYKAQTVQGTLGGGGTLRVQGAPKPPAPAPQP